jgi:peroxiredoxin
MALKVGDIAPEIKLFSSEKNEVSLSDYRGKNVLILFFPLAFTKVCTAELCEMRDNLSLYNNLNADIIAISVDTPQTLAKFKELENYNFTLLSDFNKQASTDYGCIYENFVMNMKGVSKRSAFIIDKNGVIQYAEVLENAGEVPNFNIIKETLQKLN